MGNPIHVNPYKKELENAVRQMQMRVLGGELRNEDENEIIQRCNNPEDKTRWVQETRELNKKWCLRRELMDLKVSELPKNGTIKTPAEFVRIDQLDDYFDNSISPAGLFLHHISINPTYTPLKQYFTTYNYKAKHPATVRLHEIIVVGLLVEAAKEFIAIDKVSGATPQHIAKYLVSAIADGSLSEDIVSKISEKIKTDQVAKKQQFSAEKDVRRNEEAKEETKQFNKLKQQSKSGSNMERIQAAAALKAHGIPAIPILAVLMLDYDMEVSVNALISLQDVESRHPGAAAGVLGLLVDKILTCKRRFRPEEVYLQAIQTAGVIGSGSKDGKLTGRLKNELKCFAKTKDHPKAGPWKAAAEQALARLNFVKK